VIDYIGKWTARAEVPAKQLLAWMGLPTSKWKANALTWKK